MSAEPRCPCNAYKAQGTCYHTGYKPPPPKDNMTLRAVPSPVRHTSNGTAGVLEDVAAERHRQLSIWGEQLHSPMLWFAILGEEIGEVAKEIVDGRNRMNRSAYRDELIQVAAVAVAAVEALDKTEVYRDGQ